MTRLVKNTCWYINFFHFSKFFHNRKNLSKHFNIFKFKICLNLPSNFFIQIGVVAKPFEPVLWNFAWQNGRSCAFRRNKVEFFNINTLCTIKVSFVTVVIDGRVSWGLRVSIAVKSSKTSFTGLISFIWLSWDIISRNCVLPCWLNLGKQKTSVSSTAAITKLCFLPHHSTYI